MKKRYKTMWRRINGGGGRSIMKYETVENRETVRYRMKEQRPSKYYFLRLGELLGILSTKVNLRKRYRIQLQST